ncbi:MAG: hypothetical protein R3247_03105 [Rhodothermales bacterium]|nr:hypothetical protein [Rhodothermales bacterium]
MDVLKYFYEEPASLDVLSDDLDPDARRQAGPALPLEALFEGPRYYRGYLAGTDLATGRIGLTALAHPASFAAPLLDVLEPVWRRVPDAGTAGAVDPAEARAVLQDPRGTALLASGGGVAAGALVAAAGPDRRRALPALRSLLDGGAVVLLPEPAHDGFDWSLFAARPLRAVLVDAFRRHPAEGVRRFVIPYRRARGEHRFYFEQWQLDAPLPAYIEEV